MKNKISLAIIGAFSLAFAGCMEFHERAQGVHRSVETGHAGGAYEPRNATVYDLENSGRLVLMDRGVRNSVTSSGIQERINADGRLEVIANIRNRDNRRIHVQIGCVFKDEQGFSTGDETPWRTLILTENSQESVKFISMNDKARRYTIRIRQTR
ncbi:MAG: YcfL family protein [Verrucomicrobiota bacterium]